jgi:poly-gamma-glutamate synthesis protein (capsule biosynthesis protein)
MKKQHRLRATLSFILLLSLVACAQPAVTSTPTAAPRPAASLPPPSFAPLQTATGAWTLRATDTLAPTAFAGELSGYVMDLNGQPVADAEVHSATAQDKTNVRGWFSLPAQPYGQWVTVTHPAYISRTRAVAPGEPAWFRLTPDDGQTLSLLFAGDVMFGRRFFDPNEDGDFSDGTLPTEPTAADHLRLLAGVQPLLENADLSFVNLETPLSERPALDYTQVRPEDYHQTKEYVYSSHPSAVAALRQAGVDLLGLGNNHVFDLRGLGLDQTLQALAAAGFAPQQGYFGAGDSAAEAWQPAVVEIKGQKLAFLGCTSITGEEHDVSYVAEGDKGGAANCTEAELSAAVSEAVERYDAVILMIHGGYEYSREPSPSIVHLTELARQLGADLVINHHTHTIGGLDWNGSSLVAWSLGNFVFDQTVWPTFESCVLVVHLRQGQVVNAYAEPLMIENFQPVGVTGAQADSVGREIAGRSQGPLVLLAGAVETDFTNSVPVVEQTWPVNGDAAPGIIEALEPGQWLAGFSGPGTLRLGRDLLWVGSFEDDNVSPAWSESIFWTLEPPYREVSAAHAYAGLGGVGLRRGSQNSQATFLSPIHRMLVEPGSELSVTGMLRSSANAIGALQVSWYADTKGPSEAQAIYPLPAQPSDEWLPFRIDLVVPEGVVAIGLYFKLAPPLSGFSTLELDDLHLIAWAPPEATFTPLYDFYWLTGEGALTLHTIKLLW